MNTFSGDYNFMEFKRNLIYDLGAHKGEDSLYYLRRGFHVVAVEANPQLAEKLKHDLQKWVCDKKLIVVNAAICASDEATVTFYNNLDASVWGTIDPEFAKRNHKLGTKSVEMTVDATNLIELFTKFGVPYYLKIDIEGMDTTALAQLEGSSIRPKFVSIESEKVDMKQLKNELQLLTKLGYDNFKVIQQASVSRQIIPKKSKEGEQIKFRFKRGSSGLFGEDLPGPWLSMSDALVKYEKIFKYYKLLGDDSFVRKLYGINFMLRVLQRITNIGLPGWYDTHAKLKSDIEK